MSDELKLARARQRLKNLNMKEMAKLPELEPTEYKGPIEITKSEQSEELLTKTELNRLLFSIIKDPEQVENIMNDINIVNDESAPLLVENFSELVKDLRNTYKSGVAFPQLKGFLKRYSAKLLKEINYESSSGKTIKNESDYRSLIYEIDNIKKLFKNSKLMFTNPLKDVDNSNRILVSDFINKPLIFFNKTDRIEQFQNLFIDNILKINGTINAKESRLLNNFVDRNPLEINKLYSNILEGRTDINILENKTYESGEDMFTGLTQEDIDKLDIIKPFTEKEVRPKIKNISKTKADELLNLLKVILTENLVNNKPGDIDLIIDSFEKGIKNPLNKIISRLDKKDETIQLSQIVDATLPLVTQWRNDKLNYLLTQQTYRNDPSLIRPEIERMSKEMFGYGLKKKRY